MLVSRVRMVFLLAYMVLSFVGFSYPPPTQGQATGQATVAVKVTGLRSEQGQVKIAVFNSPEKWLGKQPIYSATINVDSQTVLWKMSDVPYGEYGIAVLHDENKNGRMDKNFVGIPLEPYGFSNNVRVTFGPPTWEKAKFVVKGLTTEVSIAAK
jgi:uncharacterized protein (DUF2141 family)